MSFAPPKPAPAPKVQTSSKKNWLKGVVSAYDSGRTPTDGLQSSANTMLDQDGTVRPRPSLVLYGPQPVGTVIGEIFEFKTTSGLTSTYSMISMQVVAGVANIYYAKGEDVTWTKISSVSYDPSSPAHFCQVQQKVLIMNGFNNLSYFDIPTNTIVQYNSLSTPSAPILDTNTGLTGTSFNVYYAITANSTVGETAGSSVLTQPVLTDRDLWNKDTQSIKIKWSTITGVKSWNVYMGTSADGAGQPTMYLIAAGLDAATLSFTDNGTAAQDLSRPLPQTNSTAGPKALSGKVINGRPWLIRDKDNPFYVWRGGDYGYELDFSPSHGGGYTPVGNGTKEVPNAIDSFRDGKGSSMITVFTQSSNGGGKRFLLSPTNITYGNSTFVVWQVQEDSGNDGTDSPFGIINYSNSLYYPSRDGFKTTGTKPQLQNVLSTDRISNTIQNDISRLNNKKMSLAVGVAYESRLYWSLPVGGDVNSEIWVLDLARGGAWMKPWSIGADWMWLYNDNSGVTHILVLVSNAVYELSYSQNTNDNGIGFPTDGTSGIVNFSEDGRSWAKLRQVVFQVLKPSGNLTFSVTAMTDDGIMTYQTGDTYGESATVGGWGEPSDRGLLGFGRHAWSEVETVPVASGVARKDVAVEVDEVVQWYTYGWSSSGINANYQISNVTDEFVLIGLRDTT